MKTNIKRALVTLTLMGGIYAAGSSTSGASPQADETPTVVEHHDGHYVIEGPDCPTEDSCTIDYADGTWSIEEVTP